MVMTVVLNPVGVRKYVRRFGSGRPQGRETTHPITSVQHRAGYDSWLPGRSPLVSSPPKGPTRLLAYDVLDRQTSVWDKGPPFPTTPLGPVVQIPVRRCP